ncbi:MAG: aspartate aminotransferase family protein [Chloroflexi bacterium]|nr:aspartate aminotransferase family protein [Chloroflexota bacterium]
MTRPDPNMTTAERIGGHALDHLWMGNVPIDDVVAQGGPLVLTRGDGIYLWDESGRRYIDCIASLEAVAIGHGRIEIAAAVAAQLSQLEFLDTLRYVSRPAVELADRLAALAPGDLDAVHFASSGSEAVEAGLKIARQYHYLRGRQGKFKVIARRGGYHGCTYGAMAIDGSYYRTHKEYFEPLPPIGRFVAAPDDAEEFDALIRFERPDTVAAVIIDPVATASGIYPADDAFWVRLREICDEHDVLLIADEAITGFGRTGRMFASDRAGVTPDILTVSKGLSSGYIPISAAIASRKIATEFRGAPHRALAHGHTFGGHPVACAAALANLKIIDEEHLVTNAATVGSYLERALQGLLGRGLVIAVRGTGLIYGVELRDADRPDELPLDIGQAIVSRLRENGVLTFVLHPGNVLFLCPPLVINEEQVDELVAAIATSLDDVQRDRRMDLPIARGATALRSTP